MGDPLKHTRDIRRAFGLMSALPTRVEWLPERGPQVAGWFPWVGLFLGLVVWIPLVAWDETGHIISAFNSGIIAALLLVVWAFLTRGLHWDGLADVGDAWWGGNTPAERLAIMADSHIGAFGATAIVLLALVEWQALTALVFAGWSSPILWALTVSRMAATFGAWLGKPARPGGLGASVSGRPHVPAMIAAALGLALGLAPLAVRYPHTAIGLGVVGVVLALGVPHVISSRFGGTTGDVFGASVLVTEASMMTIAALLLGVVAK